MNARLRLKLSAEIPRGFTKIMDAYIGETLNNEYKDVYFQIKTIEKFKNFKKFFEQDKNVISLDLVKD